jgi:hypothetical protein
MPFTRAGGECARARGPTSGRRPSCQADSPPSLGSEVGDTTPGG